MKALALAYDVGERDYDAIVARFGVKEHLCDGEEHDAANFEDYHGLYCHVDGAPSGTSSGLLVLDGFSYGGGA